ncbi:hypothetical protein HBB16_01680 [Pseudonocardia sp. MCCB 268]|nr:hypothetical protein [Pseudonocardia cytotoxica]
MPGLTAGAEPYPPVPAQRFGERSAVARWRCWRCRCSCRSARCSSPDADPLHARRRGRPAGRAGVQSAVLRQNL